MNISAISNLAVSSGAPSSPVTPRQAPAEVTADTPGTQPAKIEILPSQALKPAQEIPPSQQELDKAVIEVNEFVSKVNSSLNFSVDKDPGQTVVKVIDVATKEVIKQFPSEEMLAIAKALDSIKGLLLKQKA